MLPVRTGRTIAAVPPCMLSRVAVPIVACLIGCASPVRPQVSASPFPVDSSLFAVVLDAVTAREAPGTVGVVPLPLAVTELRGIPLPALSDPIGIAELGQRERTIRELGFQLDSIADTGDCPGFWTQMEMRQGCPAAPHTTIMVSRPRLMSAAEVSKAMAHFVRGADEPEVVVRLLFVFTSPDGAGIIVTDYFARRDGVVRSWEVVGKRVVFQTE